MKNSKSSDQKIIDLVKASPAARVKVAVTDIDGILRGKYLHKDKFLSAVDSGFGFCNVVFGWDSATSATTTRRTPAGTPATPTRWRGSISRPTAACRGTARCRSSSRDFVDGKGGPLAVCPRQLLKRVLARGAEAGLQRCCRHGVRVVQLPRDAAVAGRQELRAARAADARHVRLLAPARRPEPAVLQRAHGRDAAPSASRSKACTPRPAPASSRPRSCIRDALEAADRAVLFKTGAKEIGAALRHHAELHGQVERAASRLQRAHPPEPVGRRAQNVFLRRKDRRAR